VVGPSAKEKAADKAELAAMLKALQTPAPSIHVDAPQINLPAAPPVNVTVEPAQVTVHAPDIKLPAAPDVFVDVGATTVHAKVEAPKPRAGERKVTYSKDADGHLVGKIVETTTRTVRADRDADGNMIAKVEE
jgi:hypothetical protein